MRITHAIDVQIVGSNRSDQTILRLKSKLDTSII